MNPSSRPSVPSTTRRIPTGNSRTTLSTTSDLSNRFSWIWFLLGGVGSVSYLGLTGYFLFKSRDRGGNGDVHAVELGEKEQAKTQYQRPPDSLRTGVEEGTPYGLTPDFVTADPEYGYGKTPDFVTAGDGKGD